MAKRSSGPTLARSDRPQQRRRALAVAGLVVWFAVLSLVSIRLMAKHLAPLDAGDRERTERGLAALAREDGAPAWTVAHVLFAECGCSARVAHHLAEQARPLGVHEHVILVGDSPELEALIQRSGLRIHHVSPEELGSRYGLDAAPILIVADPEGRVRYVGGYTQRKQAFAIEDDRIVAELRAGHAVAALPVFGCAISRPREAGKFSSFI